MAKFVSRIVPAIALVALVSMSRPASSAEIVLFDADGGGDGFKQMNRLDLDVGTGLAQNAATAITNKFLGTGPTDFLLLYQAKLNAVNLNAGTVNYPGLNSTFEITAVLSLRENVSNVIIGGTNAFASFNAAGNSVEDFIQLYYDPTPDADVLGGSGFNDGTLILSATVLGSNLSGSFTSDFDPAQIQPLDQFNADDWGGQLTVPGLGSFSIASLISYADPNFFATLNPSTVLNLAFAQGNANLPFNLNDPSHVMYNGAIPNIGAVNGLSGPDVLLQVDAAASFTVIPEPSSIVIMATGFGILGFVARRRRK